MRFPGSDVDIPADLLKAQEGGDAIFVCGAGVSKRVGFPLFKELVQGVYRRLGEDWSHHRAENEVMRAGGELAGQYDRVLRCLERRLAASDVRRVSGLHRRIRDAVRDELTPPPRTSLHDHQALLELSRDAENRIRLLTTNFDTLFERAAAERLGRGLPSHAGPAMPRPNSGRFEGVLHLHGRLPDSDLRLEGSELVLTSAEFGEAYLRSGWASRYVYDLSRTHTLVLIGYQAEDPPMRYLLEVLEADRERYTDLKRVYAFAPACDGREETECALWRAKGVEPVLYRTPSRSDHSALYDALGRWRDYAADPSSWRERRFRDLTASPPSALPPERVQEAADLLRHRDGARLLGAVSPDPAWLPVLVERETVGPGRTGAGLWVEARLDDPDMIRACAATPALDDAGRRAIAWTVGHRTGLSSAHARAWRLILRAGGSSVPEADGGWYSVEGRIERGDIDRDVQAAVLDELRPRLRVRSPFHGLPSLSDHGREGLTDLIDVDFEPWRNVTAQEVLEKWPAGTTHELGLLHTADRALGDALDEAAEAGFLDGLDLASRGVVSIVRHDENTLEGGFYPLVRLVAELWTRVSDKDAGRVRAVAAGWAASPYLLHGRLYLFALASPVFSPAEVAAVLASLDDDTVWRGDAEKELMHLLLVRWSELDPAERSGLERRLRQGPPPSLAADPSDAGGGWAAVADYMVSRILGRLAAAGAALEPITVDVLAGIRARFPDFDPAARDAADAHPEVPRGPTGDTQRLRGISDGELVAEALRLQRAEFRESGIWARLCASDPGRAVRGIESASDADRWRPDVLVPMLSATSSNDDAGLRDEIAAVLEAAPFGIEGDLRRAAAFWLHKHAEAWPPADGEAPEAFLRLWDRLADATFAGAHSAVVPPGDTSLHRGLASAGGDLAGALLVRLRARRPAGGSGFGAALGPRLTRIATAGQADAVYGRLVLARALAYLDHVDPAWAAEHLVPRLAWRHPEAPAMWPAFVQGGPIVRPRLFDAIKPALLDALRRPGLTDRDARGLSRFLVRASFKQQDAATGCSITAQEARAALAAGPAAVRQDASWQLRQMMKDGDRAEREERWRTQIGPWFDAVWPLDAASRDPMSSRDLAMMALRCGALFPQAVEAIRDVLAPCAMHSMKQMLGLNSQTEEEVTRRHPAAFLHLLDALIGHDGARIPTDLAELLDVCVEADPALEHDPAFDRLQGLRRRVQS